MTRVCAILYPPVKFGGQPHHIIFQRLPKS